MSDYSLTMSASAAGGREALLREARRLFAERGYAATSVAEIQAAAGLAPGSGALYKHFASKQALLEAVLAEAAQAAGSAKGALPKDAATALRSFAADLLTRLDAAPDLLRIELRDRQAAPELLTAAERTLAAWLAQAVLDGRVRDHDCDAMAHLLAAALLHGAVLDALAPTHRTNRDRERLLDAWVDLALTALDPRRDLLDDLAPPAY